MSPRSSTIAFCATLALTAFGGQAAIAEPGHGQARGHDRIDHVVVIYEENHSFDNLYGLWGRVHGDTVEGLSQAPASHTVQVAQGGAPYTCLKQNDVNLTTPPLPGTCTDPRPAVGTTAFTNQPFAIDRYIPSTARTCPAPGMFAPNGVPDPTGLPGGCTRDLVHRFYQEQFQIDGGRQDRYVQGSDAVGLVMGYYDTTQLPIYQYLHGNHSPNYVVADHFFQGMFGGSFLNHQGLIAAQPPIFPNADRSGVTDNTACSLGTVNCDLHSAVDTNGFPTTYPLYQPVGTTVVKDQALTVAGGPNGACAPSFPGAIAPPPGTLCGDYAVNTIQPFTQPYAPGTPIGRRLPNVTNDNIGDAISAAGVSWAWYAGGWDNAAGNNGRDALHPLGPGWTNGPTGTSTGTCVAPPGEVIATGAVFPNCPDALFQFHHQPFAYFANYADGTVARVQHLKDERRFFADVASGTLPAVSFVKPVGEENEHPGYASEANGSQHLVDLVKAIQAGPDADHTMIIVTYDEFGGQWDHVSPPGTAGNPNPHDAFGPGTRIPALIISNAINRSGVDHSSYDTTSILTTIEHLFQVRSLTLPDGTPTRDARVNDLLGTLGHHFDR
jgi:acid phosphatase